MPTLKMPRRSGSWILLLLMVVALMGVQILRWSFSDDQPAEPAGPAGPTVEELHRALDAAVVAFQHHDADAQHREERFYRLALAVDRAAQGGLEISAAELRPVIGEPDEVRPYGPRQQWIYYFQPEDAPEMGAVFMVAEDGVVLEVSFPFAALLRRIPPSRAE